MADEIISLADAKAQGLKRFFTGLPCRHGHIAERYVTDGKCVRCVLDRATIRARVWSAKNPDKRKAITQKWRDANPEKWKASATKPAS